jgi:hypothetical protein
MPKLPPLVIVPSTLAPVRVHEADRITVTRRLQSMPALDQQSVPNEPNRPD